MILNIQLTNHGRPSDSSLVDCTGIGRRVSTPSHCASNSCKSSSCIVSSCGTRFGDENQSILLVPNSIKELISINHINMKINIYTCTVMGLYISPEIFIDTLQLLLSPIDMANLKCVDRYWREIVTSIEQQRSKKVKDIVDNGSSNFWKRSSFLRLRSTMVPRYSVIYSKYLLIYKVINNLYLLTPGGDIVGFIDQNNVVYRSQSLWFKLYDAILLIFDSLPPTMTLGRFCTHCPFCGRDRHQKCHCSMKWARWFNTLLPRRVYVDRSVFRLSEDLSVFCDRHVLMDNCYDSNRNH